MANKRGKHVDSTYLSVDGAEERGFLHRDYIAHCLRWTHFVKRLSQSRGYAEAVILDVGCGREVPLAKTLYSSRMSPRRYFGVDVGPIPDESLSMFHTGHFPLKVWELTDVCDIGEVDLEGERPNWATCFEVLEHVEPAHMLRILARVLSLLTDDGTFLVSTPCWNRKDCADNHVNEMTHEALGAVFETSGWAVQEMYGTFASMTDYVRHMSDAERDLFTRLRAYYDTNFLSCVFAPLFPAQSRNCLWVLRPRPKAYERKFPKLSKCEKPWGSSERWAEMLPDHE